jgi:hypothetical protein
MKPLAIIPSAAFLLFSAAAVHGQSLADAAKKAEDQRSAAAAKRQTEKPDEREKARKTSFSDADLKPDPYAPSTPPPVAKAPEAAAPTGAAPTAAAPVSSGNGVENGYEQHDEVWWKKRMTELRSRLSADELQLGAMEVRVKSLTNDFNGSDIASQRLVLRDQRERALTEAASLKAIVQTDKKNIATAEEEARRANVPAGWLRP